MFLEQSHCLQEKICLFKRNMKSEVNYIYIWMVHQSFQNSVLDSPLLISCSQQGHTGTNVNCLCFIIILMHIMLSFVFSCAELWIILIRYQSWLSCVIKNKQIDHISNFMSKDMRTLPSFFSNTGKTEKFDPIKKLCDLQEFHIWHLTIHVKHSYITVSTLHH